jgi:hypothetical protein
MNTPSIHRGHHDASWGASSAHARGNEDRTSRRQDGAPMEDAPRGDWNYGGVVMGGGHVLELLWNTYYYCW